MELRDPTREELFNGPAREKLPVEIQQLPEDETACTFCGVSYFVFSEVQELQATAKRYKRTFHEFVQFMERERTVSRELKAQVLALKKSFDDGASVFASTAQRLASESQQLRAQGEQLTSKLQLAQRDASSKQQELAQMQSQFRRAEEEWTMASALTDQKLRNEILHLSSQLEKCRLLTASQEAEFAAETERERGKIRELELLVASSRESMSAAERQLVTERDLIKQQLLTTSGRVDAERDAAHQLETQLRAVQLELQRVLASNESERSAFSQLNGDVAALKLQQLQHEKAKDALVSERAEIKAQLDAVNDLAKSHRFEIATLEKKIEANAVDTEKRKQDYARELEKIRLEHGQTINRMQRDHQKALDDLKQQQAAYIEYLQKQTSEASALTATTLQHAVLEMEDKFRAAEKEASQWKHQVHESGVALQQTHQNQMEAKTWIRALERQLAELSSEKTELAEEVEHLQHQHDQLHANVRKQLEHVERDTEVRLQQDFDDQRKQFQRKLDGLQAKYDQMSRENEQLARQNAQANRKARDPEENAEHGETRPQAWADGGDDKPNSRRASTRAPKNHGGNNNQEQHELEKLVDSLRRTVDQKDKEIALLQQTVHRECLERTSLLEKMRSGKVLPDISPASSASQVGEASARRSASTPRRDPPTTNATDAVESEDRESSDGDPSQPKASLYERLRRAGQRKPKTRKP